MDFTDFRSLIRYGADNYPDKTAFVYDDEGKKTLSYGEFYKRVAAREAEYRSMDCSSLGLYGTYGAEWLINMFASVLSGKQTVLLDPMMDKSTVQKLSFYADIDYLCTDDNTADVLDGLTLSPLKKTEIREDEGHLLFFTSGTTEMSKAVELTSFNLCSSARNGQDKLPCLFDDTLLCVLPLSHVFGFVCGMLWPLTQGATIALGRGLRYITSDCAHFNPTIISVVPSILNYLVATKALNKSLRVILVGAGPAGKEVLSAVKALGYTVSFGYGLTETASGVAISCGDDPFAMSVCVDSVITLAEDGEILIKNDKCMMVGYYKRPEDTAVALEGGVLHTGDTGFFDENGLLHISGRKKDIIVLSNGTKIFLPEWEQELGALIKVDELAIVERGATLTAVFVKKDGELDQEYVKAKLKEFNSTKPFSQHVDATEIRALPLPRTATGKIKRWAL